MAPESRSVFLPAGATAITIEAIPPDMLVVFDRSCSMRRFYDSNEPVFGYGPTDPKTRWAMAVNALDGIMAQYENRIRFGLMVFPRPYQGCGDLPNANLLPAITNRSPVLQKLDHPHPFNICETGQQPTETPTAEALSAVLKEGVFDPAVREGYVLLMTDGMATCGASAWGLAQLLSSIRSAGAKTAVVGFGEKVVCSEPAIDPVLGRAARGWTWRVHLSTDRAHGFASGGTDLRSFARVGLTRRRLDPGILAPSPSRARLA